MPTLGASTDLTRGRAWTSLVLGVLIFLVPFVFGATPASGYANFAWNDYVVGVVVVILAAIGIWAAANRASVMAWSEGINALLGLWALILPFVVDRTASAMYANVVLGIVLVVVAGWDAYVAFNSPGGRRMTRGRAV